ncbi:hypothetical protein, partial [Acinetobacter soli]|uniref:hypothetical protein n=1 Tax=Acinetobacter soli TaxID=487316 RepID=UPI0013C2ACC8
IKASRISIVIGRVVIIKNENIIIAKALFFGVPMFLEKNKLIFFSLDRNDEMIDIVKIKKNIA